MACCGKNKLPPDQQIIADKVKQNLTKTPTQVYNSVKSNRSRPGTIAKECPKCSTKTIVNICPICSTIL